MRRRRTTYHVLEAGEKVTFNPQKGALNVACCDCGLVHRVEFTVGHRQKLTRQVWRDNRKTAALRRERAKRELPSK